MIDDTHSTSSSHSQLTLLDDKRSEDRCILFGALVPRLEGGDFPFVCLLAVLVWLSLATFARGPPEDLLLRGCFRGVALGTPGLKKRRTEDRGRHEGCCVSCTASAAGSVRVSGKKRKKKILLVSFCDIFFNLKQIQYIGIRAKSH